MDLRAGLQVADPRPPIHLKALHPRAKDRPASACPPGGATSRRGSGMHALGSQLQVTMSTREPGDGAWTSSPQRGGTCLGRVGRWEVAALTLPRSKSPACHEHHRASSWGHLQPCLAFDMQWQQLLPVVGG